MQSRKSPFENLIAFQVGELIKARCNQFLPVNERSVIEAWWLWNVKLDPSLVRQLESILDLEEAIELLRCAIGTPSITGEEADFADLLHSELERTGVDHIIKRDFLPGRPNVWAC